MIRPAEPNDIRRLLEMGRAFYEEAKVGERSGISFDEKSFAFTAGTLMDAGLILVREENGRPVAMAAADGARCWLNHDYLLGKEIFWYAEPEHRKGKDSSNLLSELEALAKARGIHLFDVVAEEGERSEALGRLYRRADYNPAERVFRKRL